MYFCANRARDVPQEGEEVAHGEILFWYKIGIRESRGAHACNTDQDREGARKRRKLCSRERDKKNGFSHTTYRHIIYILIFFYYYVYTFFLSLDSTSRPVRCTLWAGYKINALIEYLISATWFAVGRRRFERRSRSPSVTINNNCKTWFWHNNIQLILDLHTNRTRLFSRWWDT